MITNKIYIVTTEATNRLYYVLEFIFQNYYKFPFQVVSSHEIQDENVCISYENGDYKKGVSIIPNGLLKEKAHPNNYELQLDNDLKLENNRLNYDLFSDIFYCLSRMEEYDSSKKDKYGRSSASDSKLHDLGLLSIPILDIRIKQFGKLISNLLGIELVRKEPYRFIHTVDIDQFFAFKGKSLFRIAGGFLRNFSSKALQSRWQYFTKKEDPFDTFKQLWDNVSTKDRYVFVLNTKSRGEDLSSDLNNKDVRNTIQEIGSHAYIGIHPSLSSHEDSSILQAEKQRLSAIHDKPIKASRQHYLKLNFPVTYKNLLRLGITKDFTLGYHDHVGFRSGTSLPFYWYDLEEEKQTELELYPLNIMDVTLKKYMNLDPEKAIDTAEKLIKQCKSVNGTFCLLWHNSSFADHLGWQNWDSVYTKIISLANE